MKPTKTFLSFSLVGVRLAKRACSNAPQQQTRRRAWKTSAKSSRNLNWIFTRSTCARFHLCARYPENSWKPKRSYHHITFFVITHGCAFNLWVKRQYEGDACVGVQLNPKGVPSAQNYQNMLQDSFGEKCLVRVPLCLDMHDLTASYQRWVALLFVCWCDRASKRLADVFTAEVFSTTNLLHHVPFTRDTFHIKQPLYQKLFVPNVKPEGFTHRIQELECEKVTSRKVCHAILVEHVSTTHAAWQILPPTPKAPQKLHLHHHYHHHHHQKHHHHINVCMFSQSWKGC